MPGAKIRGRRLGMTLFLLAVIGGGIALILKPDGDTIRLRVYLGSRSVSKLPFVMAMDQGLFEKHGLEELREGVVDAIVAAERAYAGAKQDGFPVLADTKEWGESLSGNSVLVQADWLEDPTNREAARRFLMATVEGIALFHQNRELALDVLARWHGITDREYAALYR